MKNRFFCLEEFPLSVVIIVLLSAENSMILTQIHNAGTSAT